MPFLEWKKLTGSQFQSLDKSKCIVLVSCSPLEVHGPHLPVMADAIEAEAVMQCTAEHVLKHDPSWTFITLPMIYAASDVLPHLGSIKFDPWTTVAVLRDMGLSLSNQGFHKIWVSNFHGGPRHILAIEEACHQVNKKNKNAQMISVFGLLIRELTGGSSDLSDFLSSLKVPHGSSLTPLTKAQLKGDSHAGAVETSILLHIASEHVDPNFISLPKMTPDLWLNRRKKPPAQKGDKATLPELIRGLPIKQQYYEEETYAGDPSFASAELGAFYLDAIASKAADALLLLLAGKKNVTDCFSPLWPFKTLLLSKAVEKTFTKAFQKKKSPI